MKQQPAFIKILFTALLLIAFCAIASAGETKMDTPILETKPEAVIAQEETEGPGWQPGDPISSYDGKLVWDVQERLRFEWRENNFDFNSMKDAITDDAYLLQRFRIGVRSKPNDWFNIYFQTQD